MNCVVGGGAKADVRDSAGETALHKAAREGHKDVSEPTAMTLASMPPEASLLALCFLTIDAHHVQDGGDVGNGVNQCRTWGN